MHAGEIAFHAAIPFVIFMITAAIGYYVVTLVNNIAKMA